jgi:uncharacterized protein YvpB
MKKILDVPYLSQFNNLNDVEWQGRACGVTCLAMVLAYYEGEPRPLKALIELGTELKAYTSKYDWYDSGLCSIANNLGYSAFRRRWALSKIDEDFFVKEGRTIADNEAYNAQAVKEGLYSIENSLRLGVPVIVSVNKSFDEHNHGHLIVLTGYEKDGEKLAGFYYNDPNSRDKKLKDEYAHLQLFLEHWKRRGVFIIKH